MEAPGHFGVAVGNKTKRRLPNLAVANLSLPDMGGLQLAKKLKVFSPDLPISMLTTDYSVSTEKKPLSRGITAAFSKLDNFATLVANARAVRGMR